MITLIILCLSCVLALAAYIVIFAAVGHLVSRSDRLVATTEKVAQRTFLILVPAHNEGEHLRPTIRSLRELNYPSQQFHIVVIADNCTDNTVSVVHDEGCQIWERSEPLFRGKGYALDWALKHPSVQSYDAVVVIDADTRCSSNLLQIFAREMHSTTHAVQARVNFDFPPDSPSWLSLTSRATQRAEDIYVSAPRSYLNLYQGLQGTGFCVPTTLLKLVPWSAHSICEDLEYGFQLADRGVTVRFVQDAFVTSSMTGQLKHASQQRERWARGTYSLLAMLIPSQLLHAIRRLDWKSLEACFYLSTRSRLPLALLTVIVGFGLFIARHSVRPTLWMLFALAVLLESVYIVAIASTLRPQCGRTRLLFNLFLYSVWIIQQHLEALFNLQNTDWTRTERR